MGRNPMLGSAVDALVTTRAEKIEREEKCICGHRAGNHMLSMAPECIACDCRELKVKLAEAGKLKEVKE